ncbi:MAG: isopentenyl-diphosphate Delta-isomerase [Candidatus Kerfeldbacteria bacterium]
MEEHVVLVNNKNEVLGTAPKSTVHTNDTPLHRAFSSFIFNRKGEILLSQRSGQKKTWPLVWTNSCCGHPALNESNTDAVRRKLLDELGLEIEEIHEVLPDYRYKAEKEGLVENEICPVFIAFTNNQPILNKQEVESTKLMVWPEFIKEIKNNPNNWSPWCVEEVILLEKNNLFNKLLKKYTTI